MTFTCNGCSSTWQGFETSHCSGCHITFTTPRSFDSHRTGGQNSRSCLTPKKAGLVDAGRAYPCWGQPNHGREWE